MTTRMTVIDDGRAIGLDATIAGDRIRVTPMALAAGLGWKLEPQGLCRGEVCVPVRDRAALVSPEGVDLAGFARALGRSYAADPDERVAVLGAPAADRAARLASLEAPDFSLPDLSGRLHSLSDQRGKKTLLIAWASW